MTTTNNVETATKIVCQLEERLETLLGRTVILHKERAAISYAALTSHDKAAKLKLDAINTEVLQHSNDVSSVESALAEARTRLATAQRNEALAADRTNAEQLKLAAARLVELGAIIDDCFADITSASAELRELVNKIHGLGSPSPNHDQVRVLGALAMKTALMGTMWAKEFEHLAPSQRRTSIVNGWNEMLTGNIATRLGEAKQEEAA
jgi:hypothetical protein